jgi:maleylpyruvate isomerase
MQVYNFLRRGSSRRLHIALKLKGIEVDHVAVDLGTGQHRAFRRAAPGFLPNADKAQRP